MADDFVFQVTERPAEMLITIAGTVTEQALLEAPDARGRRVIIDARGVERMNSMGVRNWIEFMERLHRQSPDIVIRQLPPAMVSQAGMISNFIGGTRVESFLSPWFCPRCENTVEQLHNYRDELPHAITCPRCRSPMELDWDRDAYLAFRTA
jgi:hypothetical protein